MSTIVVVVVIVAVTLIFVPVVTLAVEYDQENPRSLRRKERAMQSPRTIKVRGYAQIFVPPNICYIKFSSEATDANSAAVAFKSNAAIMQKISNTLRESGVEEKNMQTLNVRLSTQYRWEQGKQIRVRENYLVQQDLQVKMRDPSKLSNLMDLAVTAGATAVSNLVYSVEDPKPYHSQIRIDAIKDAFEKAKSICEASGMTVGKPLSIVDNAAAYEYSAEDSHEGGKLYFAENSNAESSTQPGELKFSHNVEVVYEIR